MYVCICNAVTDKAIKKAVNNGCHNFDKVCKKLNVATCCGRCKDHAREVVSEALNEKNTHVLYQMPQAYALTN
ncbi:(2Fe-2S)-binding protein [Leucothrix arctica]|uniref:Bacterioferritin-associated ferredoxin n=1 Tax=Leucothrix arctica TaxID=1481894 RepID=A0A317CCV2_9GAMM|nr:(2Fe-2S)-binding protein [Leucothrix arctica]PWQ95183.1 (2Fe-2S)-binding protein [Leucothrix arctica]